LLGLLPLLKLHHITQGDLRLRMYDILVEPVLSYGAHVWGPAMCTSWLSADQNGRACTADAVHFTFLRELYGAHRTASRDVLLRDAHRAPLPCRWLSLAASWWAKLVIMPQDRLAYQVWVADMQLMLSGCVNCWTYHFFEGLEEIGFVTPDQWRSGTPGVTVDALTRIPITKEAVLKSALSYQASYWRRMSLACTNPRQGPSEGTHMHTHINWVHAIERTTLPRRDNAPGFLHLCLPRGVLQCLGRYRLGGHHLHGRLHGPTAQGRGCPMCSLGGIRAEWHDTMMVRCGGDRSEDLLHFIWECPAYDHIRDKYSEVFESSSAASTSLCMQRVFDTSHQRKLARCVAAMDTYRRHMLGKGALYGVRPIHQPAGYMAALAYPACLSQGSPSCPAILHRLWQIHISPDTMGIIVSAFLLAVLGFLACALVHALVSGLTCVV
jgi:hypothetical protein